MSINKTRGFLYNLAKFLGDLAAVKHHKIARRIKRRIAGRVTARALWRLIK